MDIKPKQEINIVLESIESIGDSVALEIEKAKCYVSLDEDETTTANDYYVDLVVPIINKGQLREIVVDDVKQIKGILNTVEDLSLKYNKKDISTIFKDDRIPENTVCLYYTGIKSVNTELKEKPNCRTFAFVSKLEETTKPVSNYSFYRLKFKYTILDKSKKAEAILIDFLSYIPNENPKLKRGTVTTPQDDDEVI
ncbi:hypothetical protein [Pontimicrobium sp. MEBiC01747]